MVGVDGQVGRNVLLLVDARVESHEPGSAKEIHAKVAPEKKKDVPLVDALNGTIGPNGPPALFPVTLVQNLEHDLALLKASAREEIQMKQNAMRVLVILIANGVSGVSGLQKNVLQLESVKQTAHQLVMEELNV